MASAAAAAQQLTPAELGQLQALTRLGVDMVRTVARTGSGYYVQAVWDFQTAWNAARGPISHALAALGASGSWFALVDDGQYGPKTATALWTVFSGSGVPQPPRRASGIPAYYTANRSLLEGLVPPETSVAQDILNEPIPASPPEGAVTVPPEVFEATQNSSGSLVREHIAVSTDGGERPGPPPGPPEVVQEVQLEPLETALASDIDMAETVVVGTPRQGGVPFIALAAGAGVLGGVFWWWTQRKGRSR